MELLKADALIFFPWSNVLEQMNTTSDEHDSNHILHLLLQSALVRAAHWNLLPVWIYTTVPRYQVPGTKDQGSIVSPTWNNLHECVYVHALILQLWVPKF